MCTGVRSCTINEGLDFGSVFVVSHEMGHSLGMYHDGDNGCDERCCIMSPSVGESKTSWSTCSVGEMKRFLTGLGTSRHFLDLSPRSPNCLLDSRMEQHRPTSTVIVQYSTDGQPISNGADHFRPGQQYTLDEQCHIYHGDCWKHELRDGQQLEDVCEMVWCGAEEGIIRTTHPALEGTYCGPRRWCNQGKCTPWSSSTHIQLVHGQWASWDDHPSSSCGSECSKCLISGQLRVRRSVRLCQNPAPNNGGQPCRGSGYRGLLCDFQLCVGPTAEQFAIAKCSTLRNDDNNPDLSLSGFGLQYVQSPCKVWCHTQLDANLIKTVDIFPDGTPCGPDRFCLKGDCLLLACQVKSLVANVNDCHPSKGPSISTFPHYRRPRASWSLWSEWQACSVSCGKGVQYRTRLCPSVQKSTRKCSGPNRQRKFCMGPSCVRRRIKEKKIQQVHWSRWSRCDANSCKQTRWRICSIKDDNCLLDEQKRQCSRMNKCRTIDTHPNDNTEWSLWTRWSSCLLCQTLQLRRRHCRPSNFCSGRGVESRKCPRSSICPQRASWTTWTSWRRCSCTSHVQRRFRHCSLDSHTASQCAGSRFQQRVCVPPSDSCRNQRKQGRSLSLH